MWNSEKGNAVCICNCHSFVSDRNGSISGTNVLLTINRSFNNSVSSLTKSIEKTRYINYIKKLLQLYVACMHFPQYRHALWQKPK